ncbi:MAG: hypothetical protein ABIJ45_05775, partial [Candidatus Zixiibacteriota bacterium]
ILLTEESFDRRKFSKKHNIDAENYNRIDKSEIDIFCLTPKKKRGLNKWYHSDIPWNDRIHMYQKTLLNFNILNIAHHGIEDIDLIEYEHSGNYMEMPNNKEKKINIDGIDVYEEDMEFFNYLWYGTDFKNLFQEDTAAELLEFLMVKEFPALRAIMRNVEHFRKIEPNELSFLNKILENFDNLEILDAFEEFLRGIFIYYILFLIELRIVKQCEFCGCVYEYNDRKKFCSLITDGRDCGKKARNKKYYENHKNILQSYYKNEMKLTREFSKSLNK